MDAEPAVEDLEGGLWTDGINGRSIYQHSASEYWKERTNDYRLIQFSVSLLVQLPPPSLFFPFPSLKQTS